MPGKSSIFYAVTLLVGIASFVDLAGSAVASNWDQTLRGRIWQYTSGTGITSSNPQIQTWTAFCNSGAFLMYGKSCVQNRVAAGYRCNQFNYTGRWQVQERGQSALVSWQTNAGRGSYHVEVRAGKFFVNGRELKVYGQANC